LFASGSLYSEGFYTYGSWKATEHNIVFSTKMYYLGNISFSLTC